MTEILTCYKHYDVQYVGYGIEPGLRVASSRHASTRPIGLLNFYTALTGLYIISGNYICRDWQVSIRH